MNQQVRPVIPEWVQDAVFYQVFPERFRNGSPANDPPGTEPWGGVPTRENYFGGDLAGLTEKLDYIADMGFNAIYLNPIFRAGTNHKYDTHDYFQVDPAFGDDAAFDQLVTAAHSRGVRLVLDGVFNHCGLGFAPFQDVLRNGPASRWAGWFDAYDYPLRSTPAPNYATCGGAHYLPRLNTRSPEVEEYVQRVALHWLERGADGWRLDVPYEIDTPFWSRFRTAVKNRFPAAYLVAEEWRDPTAFLQGDTFDGATHYLLRGLALDFVVKNALTGEAFGRALRTLRRSLPSGSETGMLTLLGSHDTPRILTECGGDARAASLLFTFLLTMPGAPLVYYGDENGMEGGNDPDCRRTMVWDEPQWRREIRRPLLELIRLRREHACLRSGAVTEAFANDRVYAYHRGEGVGRALIVLNNTGVDRTLALPASYPDGTVLKDGLGGEDVIVTAGEARFQRLRARTPYVFLPG